MKLGIDENGLTVRIVSSEAFFGPDSADLQAQAIQVLDAVAPPIEKSGRAVDVEGHPAKQPGTQPLRDWELSADRAENVVRQMTEMGGVDGKLISARGYAGNRVVFDITAPEDMKANRRVDVLVQSDESDAVKALIPEVAAGDAPEAEAVTVADSGH
ncbi:OmpA/MotB family protein [Arthrobacter sp. MDT1-65]